MVSRRAGLSATAGHSCLVNLNCTKFVQLVLMKIIKIVTTNGQILRVKCTKFDFGWGSARYPAAL